LRRRLTRLQGLWLDGEFLKLWIGQTVSQFGGQIAMLAIPLTAVLVLKATPREMGYLSAVDTLPFLLIGVFAGVFVDRLPRRPVLAIADMWRAALLAAVPALYLLHALRMAALYAIGFLTGIGTLFFDVAYMAYLPTLVGPAQLVDGNSKLEASRAAAQIAGPGLAGALVQLVSAPMAVLGNALTFVVSVASLLLIRRREPPLAAAPGRPSLLAEAREGLAVIFRNRILWSLAGCTGTANFFSSAVYALFSLYAVKQLGFTPAALGGVLAVGSIGGLAGALGTTTVTKRLGLGRTIVLSILVSGVALLLVPLAEGARWLVYATLVCSQVLLGLSVLVYNINQVSLRQTITPQRLQGRMNASMRFIVWGTMPLGALVGGFLGSAIGVRPTMALAAVGSLLAVLWVAFSPVRGLERQPEVGGEPIPGASV